jgi:hypothetical protein
MRFICLKDVDQADFKDLFKLDTIEQDSQIDKNGQTLLKLNKIQVVANSQLLVSYGTNIVKKYLERRNNNLPELSLTDYSSMTSIPLTTNLSITNTFIWDICQFSEIFSSLWFTILTETGLYLVSPKRLATSKEISGQFQSRTQDPNQPVFEGESGSPVNISKSDTIKPVVLDSGLKKLVLDKAYSLTDYIEFVSGVDASPLD